MSRYVDEKPPTPLDKSFAYILGFKQRPPPRPPPQTSLIVELPNELILSIFSHIPPDPLITGHHAWFRVPYPSQTNDYLYQRAKCLRRLSMTCRAMRSRLLPMVLEHLDLPFSIEEEDFVRNLNTITNASHTNKSLATNVKFMTVWFVWNRTSSSPFVKCLKSLPNLHTLIIGCAGDSSITTRLKNALMFVKLPQIKTLVLPPEAYPLLQHCRNVEEVACKVTRGAMFSAGFLRSLASNRDSKVKRLAIPLTLWPNPSRFVAACPRLAELTVISHYHHNAKHIEAARAISELVVACKALPDFDTFQIIRIPTVQFFCNFCGWGACGSRAYPSEEWKQMVRRETEDIEDWAIDCLKKSEAGCRKRGKRKRITLRVFKHNPGGPCHSSTMVEYVV